MRRPLFISLLLLAVLFAASVSLPEARAVRVGRNVNITGKVHGQVAEPSVAVDPRNPRILVAGAMDFSFGKTFPRCTYYRSTDAGVTWSSGQVPHGPGTPLPEFDGCGDVQVAFDRSGNLYYSGLIGKIDSEGFPIVSSFRVLVAKFANDGADFAGAAVLSAGQGQGADYPRIAVDISSGSNDGNVYLTFLSFLGGSGYVEFFTRSTDGGLSFSTPMPLPGSGLPVGTTPLVVDAAGNVFVVSVHCTRSNSFCEREAPGTVLVVKSTDGGLSFGKPIVAGVLKNIPGSFPGNSLRNGQPGPSIAADVSGVYVVWDDFGTGDADVLLTRSTDGGFTWSNPLRVNDVALGQQFLSTVTVSGGIIGVVWYDSRLGQLSNGTIIGLDVFYAQSRDLGSSFSESVRVTSVSFDPNLVFNPLFQAPWIGDYIFIAAASDGTHVIWADNRNACDTIDPSFGCVDQDLYTATIKP